MIIPDSNSRISKEDTYLNTAEVFAYRSTCLKRKYGAAIVKDDVIISTGYNGSPRGMTNCNELGICPRIKMQCHSGEGYSKCKAVHAEMNALLNCLVGLNPDTTIYSAKPCPICARMIIQAGINNVYLRQSNKENDFIKLNALDLEWYKE